MKRSATVVLRHESRHGLHYDWMIEDPTRPAGGGKLLTWRVAWPSALWPAMRLLTIDRIEDHRRAYLRRQGALSGGRGWVQRIDEGTATIHAWHLDGGSMALSLRGWAATAELRRISGGRFSLQIMPSGGKVDLAHAPGDPRRGPIR